MQNKLRKSGRKGFSLVELLVVIAVIGVIASIAVASMTNVNGNAVTTKNKKNAQNIASVYGAARAAGASFSSSTKEGIFDELVAGRTGAGVLASSNFQLNLASSEKAAALTYLSYDSANDVLSYQAGGDQPPTQQQPDYGPNGPPPPGEGWEHFFKDLSPQAAQNYANDANNSSGQGEFAAVGAHVWYRPKPQSPI